MKTSQITDADFIGPFPYWKDILCSEHVYSLNRGDAVKGQPMRARTAHATRKCRCQACRLAKGLQNDEHYKKNRAEVLERNRKYKKENQAKARGYQRKYLQTPAGKAAERRKNLKRRSADQDFYDSMTEEDHARFYQISSYFHPVVETHVDHVIPVALGGTSHPDNLAVLTAHENVIKKDRHPGGFYYCTVPLLGRYRVDH